MRACAGPSSTRTSRSRRAPRSATTTPPIGAVSTSPTTASWWCPKDTDLSSGAGPLDVLFLWHMHQPDYRDPRTGVAELPWVRLHAASAYRDMALVLREQPHVRATVNFVPSLVAQLEAVAA